MTVTALDPRLSISPQLRPQELKSLHAAGFCCIINNRPDGEEPGQPLSAELAAEAERLGLAYHHIPVVPGQLNDSDAAAFAEVLAGAPGPVLAFCRTGARSTALWKRGCELVDAGH